MSRGLAAVIGLVALFSSGPAFAGCLNADAPGQVAEGKLTLVRITVEAYRLTERAYILRLRKPGCLEGSGDYDKIEKTDRIHVFTADEAIRKRLRRLVGKNVRVTGEPFGEHTVHHHAPIVMGLSGIQQR